MRLGNLDVTFHRTVRVAEGRAASNLPPSLGRMKLYKVSDYRKNCPEDWADDAYFAALHDHEAMWISFTASKPCAVMMGAGGVNALTGQKLGTKLEKDGYLVCPPQPWIDGWKDVDGTVHQFVATPHKKGEGVTVAEQIIGAESKTGAIGLAIFEPKDGAKLEHSHYPHEGISGSSYSSTMNWGSSYLAVTSAGWPDDSPIGASAMSVNMAQTEGLTKSLTPSKSLKKAALGATRSVSQVKHTEMGIGKGGKIIQKIYEDPHGIEVWKEKPTVVFAFYLVDAKTAEQITGDTVNAPVAYDDYNGPWFGLQDEQHKDVLGTSIFSGLKSHAFPGETTNVEEAKEESGEPVSAKTETGA